MITIEKSIKFIRENGILSAWSDKEIAEGIGKAIRDCAITYNINQKQELTALCFGRWTNIACFHVTCFAGRGQLNIFMNYLRSTFPKCKTLTAYRNGKFVTYKVK